MAEVWKQIMRRNFTSWEKLADFLDLSAEQRLSINNRPAFPLNLPFRLANKISKKSLEDPILKQFLPVQQENARPIGFVDHPTADPQFQKSERILHKYRGRALLLCSSACAMHCRYCFRQNFDYPEKDSPFNDAWATISKDPTVVELILSGGDPLSLSDQKLHHLFTLIETLSYIKRIRFHSRFPIGIPERITFDFLEILRKSSKQIWFVIHVNHPNELDEEIFDALKQVQKLGIPILNQSVLLKGINDDPGTLQTLCELLADNGIIPYYLHQLDRVSGAAHFEVEEKNGREMMQHLTENLSGYAVPRYVKEIPGEKSKTPLLGNLSYS